MSQESKPDGQWVARDPANQKYIPSDPEELKKGVYTKNTTPEMMLPGDGVFVSSKIQDANCCVVRPAEGAAELYGAFVITRRVSGYVNWTFGDDVPMLVGMWLSKDEALKAAKTEAEEIVQIAKFCDGTRPCRTGYCARPLAIGQKLKQIKWNDCVGYFEHYVSSESPPGNLSGVQCSKLKIKRKQPPDTQLDAQSSNKRQKT